MVRIIFSDFDETLVDYNNNYCFSDYSFNVLDKVKQNNIIFCIVTGRHIDFFNKFDKLLTNVDYIISSNGAEVYDVKLNKLIYSNSINRDIALNIIDYCNKENIEYFVNCGIDRYCRENIIDSSIDINQIVIRYDNISDININNYLKLYKEIKIANRVINDKKITIDINSISSSKGRAIYYLCNKLNISLDDCICFGDSKNDISMFNIIDYSFCVDNGDDNLKKLSYKIIDSCYNDGVFKYIDENIL